MMVVLVLVVDGGDMGVIVQLKRLIIRMLLMLLLLNIDNNNNRSRQEEEVVVLIMIKMRRMKQINMGKVVVVVVEGERGEEGMVRVTIIFMAMGMAMVEGLVVFPAVGIKKRRLNLFPRRGSMTPFIGDDGSGSMVMGDFFDDGPKSYFYRPGNDVVRYSFFVPLL